MRSKRQHLAFLLVFLLGPLAPAVVVGDEGRDESGHGGGRHEARWKDRERGRGVQHHQDDGRHRGRDCEWDIYGEYETRRGRVDAHVRSDERARRYSGNYRYEHHGHGESGEYVHDYGYALFRVPPGHLPPPGECKVWIPGLPPGHQAPPTDCYSAEHEATYPGGYVIYGGPRR